MEDFAISAEPIDADGLRRALEHAAAGAVVCFEGRVRDHNDGRSVRALSYQAYLELAVAEGSRIVAEARAVPGLRWSASRACTASATSPSVTSPCGRACRRDIAMRRSTPAATSSTR